MTEARRQLDRPEAPTMGEAWVRSLLANEDEAWERFCRAYDGVFASGLRWSLRRMGCFPPEHEARAWIDRAKSHFYGAFLRRFREFRGEGRFRRFLFQAVDHFVLARREEILRRRTRWVSVDPQEMAGWVDSKSHKPTEKLSTRRTEVVEVCLQRLTGPDWDVVYLRWFGPEKRSLREVAHLVDEGYAAVRKRYQRALRKLRASVERRESDGL